MRSLRTLLAAVLLLLGCAAVPAATAAWWLERTVSDTDSYVATVAPLSDEPAVQRAVARRLAAEVTVPLGRTPWGEESEPLVRAAVDQLVRGPEFARAWRAANRAAHPELLGVLEGRDASVARRRDGTVSIELAGLTGALRAALTEAGLPRSVPLPPVRAALPVATAAQLEQVRAGYLVLAAVGPWLPVAAAVLLAVGVLVAPARRAALLVAALGSLAGVLLLLAALAWGRGHLLAGLPPELPTAAAGAAYDVLTGRLRDLAGTVVGVAAGVALLVVLGSWLGRRRAVR